MSVHEPWRGRRLHFVGIGGAGMSGLALVALRLGAVVSGSDRARSSYLDRLLERGVSWTQGHRAENVPAGAEVVYSSAVPAENPERRRGREGAGELHRADLLAQIAQLKRCVAVTGTHGKTTTSAMIAHVLAGCGMDPAYVIGGQLRASGLNADWGEGDWIVVEADESDRSLLALHPEIAVLTNAELDHHATYRSRLELEETFRSFMGRARVDVVWDRPELRSLCDAPTVVPYDGLAPVLTAAGARFRWNGRDVALVVPGLHNAVNAAGALTAAAQCGADIDRAVAAIASFAGARRRLEPLGRTASGADVLDDYAHHPTEVAAALAAARTLAPRRLLVAFQPHLYSRTRALARDFGAALAAADACVVLDVYPAREDPADFPGVDGRLVAAAAADAAGGRPVAWMPRAADAEGYLRGLLREGDLLVVMGAGDVDRLGRGLVG